MSTFTVSDISKARLVLRKSSCPNQAEANAVAQVSRRQSVTQKIISADTSGELLFLMQTARTDWADEYVQGQLVVYRARAFKWFT